MQACPSNSDFTPHARRRLEAVSFLDVVGYSILMARDETRTYQRWVAILDGVIRPEAVRHNGRIVKSTGDGVLATFPTAVDAVEWAQVVQRLVHSGSAADGALPEIALRVAVHLGEVIATDDDIFGDTVNIAARLQEHGEPGGILLSEAVYSAVRDSLGLKARDLGLLELKNLEAPVRAYSIAPEVGHILVPTRPERGQLPSIAVLPLLNMGGDPGDEYFSDGIVEDITISLAGLHELMVISHGSTLAFRGRQSNPQQVGRLLGVRYVLTGSIRRSEHSMRVSVELCNAETGRSLWGQQMQFAPAELFDVQDNIIAKIVAGIAPNVRAAELRSALRKKPDSFTSYDYTLRGLHIINNLDRDTFPQAREYLTRAMEEDPQFAVPVAWAARWYSLYVGQGWTSDYTQDAARAIELAARAIQLDASNALALATYAHLKSYLFHDYQSALIYFDRALAACPNHSLAWLLSSGTLSYVGRAEQAIKHAEQGLRLSPSDGSLYYYYMFLNLAHYAHDDYEEALKWGRMSANENPTYTANHRFLIADLVALGQVDEARAVAADLMRLEPDFRISVYERTRQPFQVPEMRARLLGHLRTAGLPE
jgi:adenylate cyclase